jgi:hypothetical protein
MNGKCLGSSKRCNSILIVVLLRSGMVGDRRHGPGSQSEERPTSIQTLPENFTSCHPIDRTAGGGTLVGVGRGVGVGVGTGVGVGVGVGVGGTGVGVAVGTGVGVGVGVGVGGTGVGVAVGTAVGVGVGVAVGTGVGVGVRVGVGVGPGVGVARTKCITTFRPLSPLPGVMSTSACTSRFL